MVPGVCATPSTPHHPPPLPACQPSPKAVPSLEAPFPVLTRTSTRSVLLGAPFPPQLPTSHRSSSPSDQDQFKSNLSTATRGIE